MKLVHVSALSGCHPLALNHACTNYGCYYAEQLTTTPNKVVGSFVMVKTAVTTWAETAKLIESVGISTSVVSEK